MELLKNLELVNVEYEEKKAVLTFYDKEREEIREVNFNKQSWNDEKKAFTDDPEKEAKVEEWCSKYFNTTFDGLVGAVGVFRDVYAYDNFNSLWECDIPDKFTEEDLGLIDQAEIKEIIVDNIAIKIRLNYNNKTYESKMTYAKYMELFKKFAVDPQKKLKQFAKFEEKFGVSVENKDQLIGKKIMFEVKKALGKHIYIEIKKDVKKKK